MNREEPLNTWSHKRSLFVLFLTVYLLTLGSCLLITLIFLVTNLIHFWTEESKHTSQYVLIWMVSDNLCSLNTEYIIFFFIVCRCLRHIILINPFLCIRSWNRAYPGPTYMYAFPWNQSRQWSELVFLQFLFLKNPVGHRFSNNLEN